MPGTLRQLHPRAAPRACGPERPSFEALDAGAGAGVTRGRRVSARHEGPIDVSFVVGLCVETARETFSEYPLLGDEVALDAFPPMVEVRE